MFPYSMGTRMGPPSHELALRFPLTSVGAIVDSILFLVISCVIVDGSLDPWACGWGPPSHDLALRFPFKSVGALFDAIECIVIFCVISECFPIPWAHGWEPPHMSWRCGFS